jgi:hypothetical protein
MQGADCGRGTDRALTYKTSEQTVNRPAQFVLIWDDQGGGSRTIVQRPSLCTASQSAGSVYEDHSL